MGSAARISTAAGKPGRSGDDVHAVVQSVDPVDVGVARRAEHDRGSRRRPEAGVGGPVGGAVVGLGLHDPCGPPGPAVLVHQHPPDEVAGHHPGVPVEEFARQSGSHPGSERYRGGAPAAIAVDLADRAPRQDRRHPRPRQRVPRGRPEQLLELGMDVARLNFSHGSHADHASAVERIRAASRQLGRPVAVLQDLQGPKIRTGPLKAGRAGVTLATGDSIVITTEEEVLGDEQPDLHHLRPPGRGRASGRPAARRRRPARAQGDSTPTGCRSPPRWSRAGCLKRAQGHQPPRRGPPHRAPCARRTRPTSPSALAHGVDYVALSFVRTAERRASSARAEHGAGRPGGPDHRQDREAGGAREHRRDPRGGRRAHGGARRPGRRDACRSGCPACRRSICRQGQRGWASRSSSPPRCSTR